MPTLPATTTCETTRDTERRTDTDMGIFVTATDAAKLIHRSERMVRWHISEKRDLPAKKRDHAWLINTDDLARVPGWRVDREALARLELKQSRSYGGLVARVEAMEARARSLERHIAALEAQLRALLERDPRGRSLLDRMEREDSEPTPLPEGQQPPSGTTTRDEWFNGPDEPHSAPERPSGNGEPQSALATFPAAYRGPATVTLLDRGPSAARTFATRADAGRWLERHGVNANTPKTWPGWRHVGMTPRDVLTFALALPADHRRRWRLTRCDDAGCVCQELVEG
ncbi:MAG TPA: hypothetical protein VFN78_03820 [Ktedonobacterales bacterium]|nr:hypothetical protein [Ktedonobacterales bacterium]